MALGRTGSSRKSLFAGRHNKGGGVVLGSSQRTLRRCDVGKSQLHVFTRCLVSCLIYFGIGAAYYTQAECWSGYEALYFLMVTASTVGFGDLYPGVYANSSCPDAPVTFSRIFTVVYIFLGIGVVFAQVSSLIAQLFRPIFRRLNNFLLTAVTMSRDTAVDRLSQSGPPKLPDPVAYYMKHLAGPLVLIVAIQCMFAAVFTRLVPGLDFGTAMYHCLVTATTVGYGDVPIPSAAAKMWGIFHITISVSLIAAIIGSVGELAQRRDADAHKVNLLSGTLNVELMKSLDTDGNGVDKFKFVTGMLMKLHVLSEEDVEPFVRLFEEMDADGSGMLTEECVRPYALHLLCPPC